MDEMFDKMEKMGMTEDKIMHKIMGDMEVKEKKNGEMSFDPEMLNIDPDMFKAFNDVMEEKAKTPDVYHCAQKL
jgi:hypothetical protein